MTEDQITDAVGRLDTAIRYTELAMVTGTPEPGTRLAEIAQANALIAVAERLDTLISVLKDGVDTAPTFQPPQDDRGSYPMPWAPRS